MSSTVATPLFRLVTPTVSVTLAGATTNANTTFNTNVPSGMYMNIRRIRTVMSLGVTLTTAAAIDQALYELTEDTTKTSVSQSDPYALQDGGWEYQISQLSAVGDILWERNLVMDQLDYLWPHPGEPTVAQQLNLVTTGIRVVGTSVQKYSFFLQLYYELLAINDTVRSFLTNRIVLQRTT